ncbi:MAG: hypothetical protein HOY78_41090, partial [Saccharothrix sp.]|nr:hypothetical protein [Saccharothrix sp.]
MRRLAVTSAVTAAVVLVSAMTAGAAPAKKGWHGLGWDLPAVQATDSVPGTADQPRPAPDSETRDRALTAPPEVRLPETDTTEVDLAPAGMGTRTAAVAAGRSGLALGRGQG